MPIWPQGFRLAATTLGVEVVDASGRVLARQDDAVRSTGGETVTERYAYELMGGPPPSTCRTAAYWVATRLEHL